MARRFFTSESVTEGHPDKICDQISDAVLDAIIARDPDARVACETTATTGLIYVMGEISTDCYVDIPSIVRGVVSESPSDIHTIIRSLTDGGGRLGQIRSAQRSFRRPDIAKDIAVYVSELAGLPERFP